MRILVCGGRDYMRRTFLNQALDDILETKGPIDLLIHGAAAGADSLARDWANKKKIPVLAFPANWNTHGRAAGMIRNKQMLDEGKPDLVIAFPGGKGTANMIKLAEKNNISVIQIEDDKYKPQSE